MKEKLKIRGTQRVAFLLVDFNVTFHQTAGMENVIF
jgi:hypothetical protein